jgi:DNA-directed RNA polymerase subunit RPC12/RpoP
MAVCPECGSKEVLWKFYAYTDGIDVMRCCGCGKEFYVEHKNNGKMTTPEEVAALQNEEKEKLEG